jgi:hypothetical protein
MYSPYFPPRQNLPSPAPKSTTFLISDRNSLTRSHTFLTTGTGVSTWHLSRYIVTDWGEPHSFVRLASSTVPFRVRLIGFGLLLPEIAIE